MFGRLAKSQMFPLALLGVVLFITSLFSFYVLAQTADIPLPPTTTNDVLSAVLALIGGAKGASTLAIVGMVVQLLSAFVLSPLWDSLKLDPKYKFLAFALASVVGSVVPLMMQGQSFLMAISSSAVLILLMQYGHRIYELFFEKKQA